MLEFMNILDAWKNRFMDILFITTLYPDNESQKKTDVPYTLHNFVKSWKKSHNVEVIKIEATYPSYIPVYRKNNIARIPRNNIIDDVPITVKQLKKNILRNYTNSSIKELTINLKTDYINRKYDIIIFHVFYPNFFIAKAISELFDCPVIWGFHQSDIIWLKKVKNKKVFNRYKDKIDMIGFRSQKLKKEFSEMFIFSKPQFLIHSGINCTTKLTFRNSVRKLKNIITVANLIKRKNIDILIKSFYTLFGDFPYIELTIVGDGPKKKSLVKLCKRLKIANKVHFLGYLKSEDVDNELEKNDIFILPSINETFGLVYLEAMAKACITVGTINEGIDGVIVNGINGFLSKPDVKGCSSTIRHILSLTTDEVKKIQRESINTIMEKSEKKCADNYLDMIKTNSWKKMDV